jgi:hypothetical protein
LNTHITLVSEVGFSLRVLLAYGSCREEVCHSLCYAAMIIIPKFVSDETKFIPFSDTETAD